MKSTARSRPGLERAGHPESGFRRSSHRASSATCDPAPRGRSSAPASGRRPRCTRSSILPCRIFGREQIGLRRLVTRRVSTSVRKSARQRFRFGNRREQAARGPESRRIEAVIAVTDHASIRSVTQGCRPGTGLRSRKDDGIRARFPALMTDQCIAALQNPNDLEGRKALSIRTTTWRESRRRPRAARRRARPAPPQRPGTARC